MLVVVLVVIAVIVAVVAVDVVAFLCTVVWLVPSANLLFLLTATSGWFWR